MFGNLTYLIPVTPAVPAKDVPPPTPINLPRCYPQAPDHDVPNTQGPVPSRPAKPLTAMLQGIVRPTEVSLSHLEALGTHVVPDAGPAELIPDPAFIPDFEAWHALSSEEVHATNESTRKRLNTGNLSPGCQTYLERRRELSIANEAAYRTVRRLPAPKGQSQARLGNAYEFYRHLELFTAFWEDTSRPPKPETKAEGTGESKGESNSESAPTASEGDRSSENGTGSVQIYRTGCGSQMPGEYRQNIITAFLKLVAYDFACNVTMPRTEPRLHITSNASSAPRSSYFSSGCTFVFRSPATREEARAGIVEGPVAAVSARNATSFPPADSTGQPTTAPDRDSVLDLARELVAALITAQHRAREGRTEKRIGENAWWATKPRWGGGPGGPIGREIEMQSGADETIGDKDAPPPERPSPPSSSSSASDAMALPRRPFSRPGSLPGSSSSSSGRESGSAKGAKRLKKSGNHPMYDNYRMVRPPASTWDKKTKYAAIGRAKGAGYDDIFVVSSVLHHVSILRVRVPDRLLAVLEGEVEDGGDNGTGARSWGRLEVWRSQWFDLFKVEDRVGAMQLLWSMMAWLMREDAEGGRKEEGQDVKMTGA
ncbi:hypothetical protein MFIFM68171_07448 [Madurella fahalii]|uniref:Uncharacterized protein n=1 Tax=Madurella fahalii TaxID=1157608 RepID=A0ABQ0GHK2_9PEZI